MQPKLLTRDEFREGVFARDHNKCVICPAAAQDAHHILERKLWPDGGYYLDNGASLCGVHHLQAEQTTLECETIRLGAGIENILLPPHLYRDQRYDKWGNPILVNGTRLKGELFHDESVQKILEPVLNLFTEHVKYPRTYHLPTSPGRTKDDRVLPDDSCFKFKEVVVTLKMDGENTTLYSDFIHARALAYEPHPSRNWAKVLHAKIAQDIPAGWRLCGENLAAVHSIKYDDLDGYFQLFSIWNDRNVCLSWDETKVYAELFGIPLVPEIFRGFYQSEAIAESFKPYEKEHEGYVVRLRDFFPYSEFKKSVGKYVRKNHVQTHGHWFRNRVEFNGLKVDI